MEQIKRIQRMEEIFDRAESTITDLQKAVDAYQKIKTEIDELEEYYYNGLWRKDFEDDNSGKIPTELKRGVLSEDEVWNMFEDRAELFCQMREMAKEKCDTEK